MLFVVGLALLAATTLLDALAYVRARSATASILSSNTTRRDRGGADRARGAWPRVLDLGLGDDAWVEAQSIPSYRVPAGERPRLVGAVGPSLRVARRAFVASLCTMMVCGAIAALRLPAVIRGTLQADLIRRQHLVYVPFMRWIF
jgi:hypothetical protein